MPESANQLQAQLPNDLRALVLGYVPDTIVTTRHDRMFQGASRFNQPLPTWDRTHGACHRYVIHVSECDPFQPGFAGVGHGTCHQHGWHVSRAVHANSIRFMGHGKRYKRYRHVLYV
jgi:hypothetical protein